MTILLLYFSILFYPLSSMSEDEILLDIEDRMEKAVAKLRRDLTGIRTGRANPGLVDTVRVMAYGVPSPLKQVATIACPEPNQIVIRPFDVSTLKDIEKAVIASDLGYTPSNDGRVVRINIPPLSTQVRQKMVARVKELCEDTKIAIRNVRRDGNKMADQSEKDKVLSEDRRDETKAEIQNLTKRFEDEASDLARIREKEVLEN